MKGTGEARRCARPKYFLEPEQPVALSGPVLPFGLPKALGRPYVAVIARIAIGADLSQETRQDLGAEINDLTAERFEEREHFRLEDIDGGICNLAWGIDHLFVKSAHHARAVLRYHPAGPWRIGHERHHGDGDIRWARGVARHECADVKPGQVVRMGNEKRPV